MHRGGVQTGALGVPAMMSTAAPPAAAAARTRQVARLGDMPNQEDWDALPLGHLQQRGGALAHLRQGGAGMG